MSNRYYILLGQTESGDRIGPYLFSLRPTELDVDKILKRDWYEDYDSETISSWQIVEVDCEN